MSIRLLIVFLTALAVDIQTADAQTASPFAFRSDPWVNLHHFLYHEARNTLRRDDRLRWRVRTYREDRNVELNADQAVVWHEALKTYASYAEQHLIFDRALLQIGNTVLRGPDAFPTDAEAEPAYRALRLAMPVYLEHWWPRHDATNRSRIETMLGYLGEYGQAMANHLAEAYGVQWPSDPILVDFSNYSGRHGAYAVGNPNHIVFASGPDWYPGLLALDLLFHEAGHTLPFEVQITRRSEAAAKAAGVDEGDVWHAFLFYVPSQAAREVLPASHTPYAYFEDGPLVDGRMAKSEPYIRAAMKRSRDLDEIFRYIHEARAADTSR